VFVLGLSFVGGYGVWVGNRYLVLSTGVVQLALSVLGVMSIAPFVAPAAMLFTVAGVLLVTAIRGE
jgi:hypothetical protein